MSRAPMPALWQSVSQPAQRWRRRQLSLVLPVTATDRAFAQRRDGIEAAWYTGAANGADSNHGNAGGVDLQTITFRWFVVVQAWSSPTAIPWSITSSRSPAASRSKLRFTSRGHAAPIRFGQRGCHRCVLHPARLDAGLCLRGRHALDRHFRDNGWPVESRTPWGLRTNGLASRPRAIQGATHVKDHRK